MLMLTYALFTVVVTGFPHDHLHPDKLEPVEKPPSELKANRAVSKTDETRLEKDGRKQNFSSLVNEDSS